MGSRDPYDSWTRGRDLGARRARARAVVRAGDQPGRWVLSGTGRRLQSDDTGSAVVEFLLVGIVLTGLTFAVIQIGLAFYVRNLVHDAAVEGAYHAALADVEASEGAARAKAIVDRTIGAGFVTSAHAREIDVLGGPGIEVTMSVTLPLIGVIGIPGAWEVTAYAPAETLSR